MTITVTGDSIASLHHQLGLDDHRLLLTIRARPQKYDPEHFARGGHPQRGCIIDVERAEVPLVFDTAADALRFLAGVLEERDRRISEAKESPT